jgi:aspartate kinase
MSLLVMKFGGTSVGDVDRIKNAAAKVAAEVQRGHKVAVVVSAMAGVTDELIGYCRMITPHYDRREYDAVVSTGEQVSAGLMALALQQRGLNARSWQGWQIALRTDARHGQALIEDIDVAPLLARLNEGEIGVVAGFQGVTQEGRITTLGRGGGDISAVALAVMLKADRCDIYTDVDGIYTTNPDVVMKAQKLSHVTYEEMLEMASLGAKVLQTRSVEMGMRHRIPMQVLSTFANSLGSDMPGTLVTDGDETMEHKTVTGIAYSRDDAKITVVQVADRPGVAAAVFGPLARAGINLDMIVQTASDDGRATDITFTVGKNDMDRACKILEDGKDKIDFKRIMASADVTKLSLVGIGLRRNAGIAALAFETLADKGVNIMVIETSEITLSMLISEEYTELALRALHAAFKLDKV